MKMISILHHKHVSLKILPRQNYSLADDTAQGKNPHVAMLRRGKYIYNFFFIIIFNLSSMKPAVVGS